MRELYGYEHFKANKGVHPPLNEGYQQFLTGVKIVHDKKNLKLVNHLIKVSKYFYQIKNCIYRS